MAEFQGISRRAVASTILRHYCSRKAYVAALAGQSIERHEPTQVRQIRITPTAHHYVRALAAELGARPGLGRERWPVRSWSATASERPTWLR